VQEIGRDLENHR